MNENVLKKLVEIQRELKAPKNQYNSFGKYNYRSCEDILEAVKPLANNRNAVVCLSDDVLQREGRYYIEATATLIDADTGEVMSVKALARESQDKKGMDDSQITGTASSYARKYALNGLFAIDDTKDDDSLNDGNKNQNKPKQQNGKPTEGQLKRMWAIAGKAGIDENGIHEFIMKAFKKQSIKELTGDEVKIVCERLEKVNG